MYPNALLSSLKFKDDISKRVNGNNNPMYGKHWSEERKNNLSLSLSGINSPCYGKKQEPEVIAKRLESFKKNNDYSGENNPYYGKKHTATELLKMRTNRSEEFREKMSVIAKNRTLNDSTKNKISLKMKDIWKDENSFFNSHEYWAKLRKKLCPNHMEQYMQSILDSEFGCGEWEYVGNRALMIGNGHKRNPDFRHKSLNKLIEIYNVPDKIMTYGTLRRFKWLTTHHYKLYGYQVVYFSKADVYFHKEKMLNDLKNYISFTGLGI